jgi:hypothetical protein
LRRRVEKGVSVAATAERGVDDEASRQAGEQLDDL